MARRVTAVHMSAGGYLHEHIESVQWIEDGTTQTMQSTRQQMVDFVKGGGIAYVMEAGYKVGIKWVNTTPPYIRTYADQTPKDNLLQLPRY